MTDNACLSSMTQTKRHEGAAVRIEDDAVSTDRGERHAAGHDGSQAEDVLAAARKMLEYRRSPGIGDDDPAKRPLPDDAFGLARRGRGPWGLGRRLSGQADGQARHEEHHERDGCARPHAYFFPSLTSR